LVFLQTPVARWYDNLLITCSNTMVFFLSQSHLKAWQKTHPEFTGAALTVDQTIEVVTPISEGRASLDYQMPSKDELMAHWDSIGLRGAFWRF
jgi:Alkylmercury lyase